MKKIRNAIKSNSHISKENLTTSAGLLITAMRLMIIKRR